MLTEQPTLPLRTRVSYKADSRVTGTVVGYGTVNNGADPNATSGDHTYNVVIVKLDNPLHMDKIPAAVTFHVPFVQSVLTATWLPGTEENP